MIIAALTAKIEASAAKPLMPVNWAINQIMMEELSAYSTQRK